jgi:hypothetical protein
MAPIRCVILTSPMTTIRRLLAGLLLVVGPSFAQKIEPLATVPFVGCPADGQLGPTAAPKGKPKNLPLAAPVAAQIAWYEYRGDGGQMGILAPRGWNCLATIGSNGISLYVAPEPLNAGKILDHKNWHGFTGPVIQLSVSEGGTSGRFEVAKVIARVFPAHRDFVRNVIAEGFEPASDFPLGPFPTDHLNYKTKELVQFTTPAGHKGLGTMSWLLPSDQPISGMALLSTAQDTDLLLLNMRLPSALAALGPIITEQAEREAAQP